MASFVDDAARRVFWDTPTLQQVERALTWRAVRQRLLAHNLANVNTPGYQRQDLSFEGYLEQASQSLPLRTTHLRHFSARFPSEPPLFITTEPLPMRSDGNTVDPDLEMATLAENELHHAILTRIASGQIRALWAVMSGSR